MKPHPHLSIECALGAPLEDPIGSWICAAARRVGGFIPWLLCAARLILAPVSVTGAGPVVSNVQVRERPRLAEFEVAYDLAHPTWPSLAVSFWVSVDAGQTFQVVTNGVSGDFGPRVPSNKARRIVWRGPLRWLGDDRRELRFKLVAREPEMPAEMIRIRSGTFVMGNSEARPGNLPNEGPLTEVTFSRGFWIGRHEVTQKEWETVMGNNPSHFKGDPDLPVEQVSWEEAMEYCRRVTTREQTAGRLPRGYEYRLPTEAEWEYACRAGTTTTTAFGDRLDATQANFSGDLSDNGAVKGPSVGKTAKVGGYPTNPWGLHDMHGNVSEWCLDWYENTLPGGAVTNPTGPNVGLSRVTRGGSWYVIARYCRSAARNWYSPSYRFHHLGFRVACAPVVP